MTQITLTTPQGLSKIRVERGLMGSWCENLKLEYPNSKLVIITDENIHKLYASKLEGWFPDAPVLLVPEGEESKSIANIELLGEELLELGITREDLVIGFGGGMITDLTGFLASVYMRGIGYIAIPTSLLAMVDAAIGGKMGVNLNAKNILGTTHLAKEVLIDPDFLKTLPDREHQTGMAEVIKYGAILDPDILEDLKKDSSDLERLIIKSIKAKVSVVERDLKESNLRKILNYGHTFGHAIEAKSNYRLTHGQAISIGMALSNRIAQSKKLQSKEVGNIIEMALKSQNLPIELPNEMKIDSLKNLIAKDKKRRGNLIDFIIITELGKAKIAPLTTSELISLTTVSPSSA